MKPNKLDPSRLSEPEKRAMLASLIREKVRKAHRFPLSFPQRRLWFLDRLEPGRPTYNMAKGLTLKGRLDVAALVAAVRTIVARHEVLRTAFVEEEGKPVQVVVPGLVQLVTLVDLGSLGADSARFLLEHLTEREARRPFDLARGNLCRATLIREANERHRLLVTLHHIVGDDWSLGIFVAELTALYRSRIEGSPHALEPLDIQYGDFSVWQRGWLRGEELAAQLAYWRKTLAGMPSLLALPLDRPRSERTGAAGGSLGFTLTEPETRALAGLNRRFGVTWYMSLAAAFALWLMRLTGMDDLAFGSPVANRNRREIEPLIGFFINTLVLRLDKTDDPRVSDWLARVKARLLAAFAHQQVPFEYLVEALQPQRQLSHAPLVQVFFTFQNAPREHVRLPGLALGPVAPGLVPARFDLSLTMAKGPDTLAGVWKYNLDLFDGETVAAFSDQFLSLLRALAGSCEQPVSALPLQSEEAGRELLRQWSSREAAPYPPCPLTAMLLRGAATTPDRVALTTVEALERPFGAVQLTHACLARRADLVADRLHRAGFRSGQIAALAARRHGRFIEGCLGILRAGGTFLALDPAEPETRLRYMLEDSGSEWVLGKERIFPRGPWRTVEPPDGQHAAFSPEPAAEPDPDQSAYLVFTSGSSGRPKPVAVPHRAAASYTRALLARLQPRDSWRWAIVSSPAADLGLTAVFGALAGGGTLLVFDRETVLSGARFATAMAREAVDVLKIVPSHLQALQADTTPGHCLPRRLLILGGEAAQAPWLHALAQSALNAGGRAPLRIVNHYGPAEGTVGSLTCESIAPQLLVDPGFFPLGMPLDGTAAYLLDARSKPVPMAMTGELCLAGSQLARGYPSAAPLTATVFVPHPFAAVPGSRLYKTGDAARIDHRGRFHFLGRRDGQTKIRGFRVEPGEITAALMGVEAVAQAGVFALQIDGETPALAALVSPKPGASIEVRALRAALESRLPEFMIPHRFLVLDRLPLNANGKFDRHRARALLEKHARPDSRVRTSTAIPDDPVTGLLAVIWGELLSRESLGADDHFFQLGGHSLLAARLVARIQDLFGVDLPLRTVFQCPLLGQMARAIRRALAGKGRTEPAEEIRPVDRAKPLALSFPQRRLWFIDRLDPGTPTYNVMIMERLPGPLDPARFDEALADLVVRHETLRTTFFESGGEPHQRIGAAFGPLAGLVDLQALPIQEVTAAFGRIHYDLAHFRFDLSRGPLFRVHLLRLAPDDCLLVGVAHHIVTDAWSRKLMREELSALYAARLRGRPHGLPPLPVQYADVADWQRRQSRSAAFARQLAFWQRVLAEPRTELTLPTDYRRPESLSNAGACVRRRLAPGVTAAVTAFGRKQGCTGFMVTLAAYWALLARYSGQADISIGFPVGGRSRPAMERLIGFFVNTLVLRLNLEERLSFSDLARSVRQNLLEAYSHAEVPFERMVEALSPERRLDRTPLFSANFTYDEGDGNAGTWGDDFPEPGHARAARPDYAVAKYDLSLTLINDSSGRHPAGMSFNWIYRTSLYKHERIAEMADRFMRLLEAAVAAPDLAFDRLDLLSPEEKTALLAHCQDRGDMPAPPPVPVLIARWVRDTPDAVAAKGSDGSTWTYARFWDGARTLAAQLAGFGVGPEVPVCLVSPPGPKTAAAMLGVWLAGGAYVPLDPHAPMAWSERLLEDIEAPVLLASGDALDAFPARALELRAVVSIDDAFDEHNDRIDPVPLSQRHLAYVSFTSGSTGAPKGVAVPHAGIGRLVFRPDYVALDRNQVLLAAAPLQFDASTFELWGPLAHGGRLVWQDQPVPTAETLEREIAREKVGLMWLTASLFNGIVDRRPDALGGLAQLLIGGEALSVAHVHRFQKACPQTRLINGYGPTENTTFTCCHPIEPISAPVPAVIPIGMPIRETWVRIAGRTGEPLPPGMIGALLTAGHGLARGYWRRPDLTAAAFFPEPGMQPGQRCYATGDLAFADSQNRFTFWRRADSQVKLRGFRVEPEGVVQALLAYPSVGEAAVVARPVAGDRFQLAAFVTATEGADLDEGSLRQELLRRLPAYMVPARILALAQLPKTASGKIDRRVLERMPLPESEPRKGKAARNALERRLLALWREVLAQPGLGIFDDFFESGGHSLLATRLLARVQETLGRELPLRWIFERPSVAGFAEMLAGEAGEALSPLPAIVAEPSAGEAPLSFAQQRLWFVQQLDPESTAHNVLNAEYLDDPVDFRAVERAFDAILRRHQALRTHFPVNDGQPSQRVIPWMPYRLLVVDATGLARQGRDGTVQALVELEARHRFDLEKGPPVRFLLLWMAPKRGVLLANMHHLVTDGWSAGIFRREFRAFYRAGFGGMPVELPALPVQYPDYARWQRRHLAGPRLESLLRAWRDRLGPLPDPLTMAMAKPRPALERDRGARLEFQVPPDLAARAGEFAGARQTTPFTLYLAVYQLLLARYGNQSRFWVGIPIAGRSREEVQDLIGFFVNSLAIPVEVADHPNFSDYLERTRDHLWFAYGHADLPFEQLVEAYQPERNPSHPPLFQVMFNFIEGTERAAPIELDLGRRMRRSRFDFRWTVAAYEWTLTLFERPDGLDGTIIYKTDLFERIAAERFARHYLETLAAFMDQPRRAFHRIDFLAPEERDLLLRRWHQIPFRAKPLRTMAAWFAATAERYPDRPVLSFTHGPGDYPGGHALMGPPSMRDLTLTYACLKRLTDGLAHRLSGLGVGPETVVGMLLEPGLDPIVTILAIWKAGGAFLPLDRDNPDPRLEAMLRDAGADVLVHHPDLALPQGFRGRTLVLEPRSRAGFDGPGFVSERAKPEHLAYVIFTSGSTGTPKGVAVAHGALNPLMHWALDFFFPFAEQRAFQCLSLAFDFGVMEWLCSLLKGRTLTVAPAAVRVDPAAFHRALTDHRIDTISCTPSFFRAVIREGGALPRLRVLDMGGEALRVEDLRQAVAHTHPGILLSNGYGPTEASVDTATFRIAGRDLDGLSGSVPIGRPNSGHRVYLRDPWGNLVPPGMPGELFIGVDLARGYAGRPDFTAERFLPDPFGAVPGERLYRSGDLVRFDETGKLVFQGRTDRQVKHRGYRIELEEIAAVLLRHERVAETAVALRGEDIGRARLTAYLRTRSGWWHPAELQAFVKRHLPGYMVPEAWVQVAAIPITATGKVDMKALPEPPAPSVPGDPYTLSENPLEALLVRIWETVLALPRAHAHLDFFEAGGHSLLAARAAGLIRRQMERELPLVRLFEYPTPAKLAAFLSRLDDDGSMPPLDPVSREGPLPLSFAQNRMWFLERMAGLPGLYSIPNAFGLSGPVDPHGLAFAVDRLVARHEVLRSRFPEAEGRPCLIVAQRLAVPLGLVDLRGLPEAQKLETAKTISRLDADLGFDLARGPVVRFSLLRLGNREWRLHVNLHHIAGDGWSIGVLLRDLTTYYRREIWGERHADPEPLQVQYADAAAWERKVASERLYPRQLAYWASKLEGAPRELALPTDFPRATLQTFRGDSIAFRLDPDKTERLRHLAREGEATLFMTLLGLYCWTLFGFTRQAEIVIGTPVSRRNRPELEPLIGFFVNTLALSLRARPDQSFPRFLGGVRRTVLDAFLHQDVPFERVVETVVGERALDRHPLFQTMFTLQAGTDRPPGWPGAELQPVPIDRNLAKFDLALTILDLHDSLHGVLVFNSDLFKRESARSLVDRFLAVAAAVLEDPGRPLFQHLDWRKLADSARARYEPGSLKPYRQDSLHEPVLRMAETRPDAVAVADGAVHLSYGWLACSSSDLAQRLQKAGIGAEKVVAVWAERRWESLSGCLALWQCGAAFLPLDPAWPEARIAGVLAAVPVAGLIEAADSTLASACSRLTHWRPRPARSPDQTIEPRSALLHPHQLAYLMTTSGTTGAPKAIAVSRRAISQRLAWSADRLSHGPADRFLVSASLAFDISVWEWLAPLWAGGTAVLSPAGAGGDAATLLDSLAREAITDWHCVPSLLGPILNQPGVRVKVRGLKRFYCGGEALDAATRQRVSEWFPARCHHFYGPTEAAINVTACTWSAEENLESNAIGLPIRACTAWVVDSWLIPVTAGSRGELCLGGANLARGYLDDPARTAVCFVPDPYSVRLDPRFGGGRLYRTGDLVSMERDGTIRFIGRLDRQIKLRGVRIEPGEVESALKSMPGVADAAVLLAGEAPRAHLTAMVVLAGEADGGIPEDLKAQARQLLPTAMVPAAWLAVPRLPVTATGKRDERALQAMLDAREPGQQQKTLPRAWIERECARLWSSILEVEELGLEDNFFQMGGHSLLATQIMSGVRTRFEIELPLAFLFENPTLGGFASSLALALEKERQTLLPPIRPVARGDRMAMSLAQNRMWFMGRLEGEEHTHNICAGVRLKGLFDAAAAERAITEIVRRQESLRSYFPTEDGKAYLAIAGFAPFVSDFVDLTGLGSAWAAELALVRVRKETNFPFRLERGPLFRAVLYRLSEREHGLIVNLHHIVSDGWSVEIFSREFKALYSAFVRGRPSPLGDLAVQYADFAAWQHAHLGGRYRRALVEFWRAELAGAPTLIDLPTDRPRRLVQRFHGDICGFQIPASITRDLRQYAESRELTLFMVLHAAYVAFLHRYSGQNDIVLGSPIANRNRGEVESLIGYFVNPLVLRVRLQPGIGFGDLCRQVRTVNLAAFRHQDISFEHVVEALAPERNLDHRPIYQLMFQLQNAPKTNLPLAGLEMFPLSDKGEVTSRLDLTLSITETAERLYGVFQYNVDLFDPETIDRMGRHFTRLAGALARDPEAPIGRLPLLTEEERDRVLHGFRQETDGGRMLADTTGPLSRFAGEGFRLGWLRRNRGTDEWASWPAERVRAHALATAFRLLAMGVMPGDPVRLDVADHGLFVLGVLGIWLVGGCAVPVQGHGPEPDPFRAGENAGVLLRDREGATEEYGRTLALTDAMPSAPHLERLPTVPAATPAFVQPAVGGNVRWALSFGTLMTEQFGVAPERLRGTLLVWPAAKIRSLPHLIATCLRGDNPLWLGGDATDQHPWPPLTGLPSPPPDWLVTTPPLYRQWKANARQGPHPKVLSIHGDGHLRDLEPRVANQENTDGETSRRHWMAALLPLSSECWYPAKRPDPGGVFADNRPWLPPSSARSFRVLDPWLEPLPPGVTGDLFFSVSSSVFIAFPEPGTSAAALIPDPHAANPGHCLWPSGLRAALDATGGLHLDGRVGDAAPVRTFVCSLERVARVLRGHPQVADVHVHRLDGHGKGGLVARVRARLDEGHALPDRYGLQRFAREHLPAYAVPDVFRFERIWPLTPEGDFDPSKLPALVLQQDGEQELVYPRNLTEWRLAAIFAETLDRESWSVRDNFFDGGGVSLMAVSMMERVNRCFGTRLPIGAIYHNASVEDMAATILSQLPEPGEARLVRLNACEQGTPLVWIHPEGGLLDAYLPLAGCLGTALPLWGLEHAAEQSLETETAWEALADRYLDLVHETLHGQPVVLAGISVGGRLVRLMAGRARARALPIHPAIVLEMAEAGRETGRGRDDGLRLFARLHGLEAPHSAEGTGASLGLRLAALLEQGRSRGSVPPYLSEAAWTGRFHRFRRDRAGARNLPDPRNSGTAYTIGLRDGEEGSKTERPAGTDSESFTTRDLFQMPGLELLARNILNTVKGETSKPDHPLQPAETSPDGADY